LEVKIEQGELDFMFAYARSALLNYARWMLDNERPYFDHPEDLEYPTEAWAAQEFRKANVLRLASAYADEPLKTRLFHRGGELADRAWSDLLGFDTRTASRAMAVLMIEGTRDAYFRVKAPLAAPCPTEDYDFGKPEMFVPQRKRVLAQLKTAGGAARAICRLSNPTKWKTLVCNLRRMRN
jgi:hypothetical protein